MDTQGKGEENQVKLLEPSRPPVSRSVTNTLNPGCRSEVLLQAKKNTVLKSHGRPPWYNSFHISSDALSDVTRYDEDGHAIHDAFVIGIAGTSFSSLS